MGASKHPTELRWVLRPDTARPAAVRALAGRLVHAVGVVGTDGFMEVVLHDGTRLRVRPTEVVTEQRR
jgi:hypothetical protein